MRSDFSALGLDFHSPFDILKRPRGEPKDCTGPDRRGPKHAGKSIELPGSSEQVMPQFMGPTKAQQIRESKAIYMRQQRAMGLAKRKPLTRQQMDEKNARARRYRKENGGKYHARTELEKQNRREREQAKKRDKNALHPVP